MDADRTLFRCVVCGVDGTEESSAAVAQVGRLIEASGGESHVVLVSVWNTGASVAVGWSPGIARTGSFPEAELRAEMDILAAVSACPADTSPTNGGQCRPLGIRIYEGES